MKKLHLTLLLTFIFAVATAQTVEMNYTFETPSFTTLQGYEQVQFRGCLQSALAGQPSLPWKSVSLMLPQGCEAQSIEVILSDFQEIEGTHNLFPYQPSRAYSDPERREFLKDESIYASKAQYPTKAEGNLSTYYMNGIGFAFSAFTPVQYEPATGKIRYANKAKVVVHTTASRADQSRMLWLTPNNVRRAERLAQNPEMMLSYDRSGRDLAVYDILVITKEQWVEQFEDYKGFYGNRGLRVRIASLESILSATAGQDNPEKLRNYIIQEYQENGISMVNLGGDVPNIPYRGLYCYVTSGGGDQEDNDIPADLYFAALDGTWNDNGNNRWGEIGEDDLLPEIGIGRMCFNDQSEFNNIMHKTYSYQAAPVLGEFHKVILAGEHLYDNPLSNGSQYLELLVGERSDNGYTTVGIPTEYNFTKLYYETGTWSGNNLMSAINQGTQSVHHDGHANTTYVADWYTSDINDGNFSGANGVDHNYTTFHTSGCVCGDFSSSCILEKMTKIQNFAVATIGNSRYGWFNEGQTEGPAIHLHRETEDAYYHDCIPQAGLALSEAKCQTAPWVTAPGQWEEGALRWNFYDLNLMGDVALNTWHDEPFTPEVSYTSEILVGIPSTTVNVTDEAGNGLYNFRCAVFHGEELIGMAYTDHDGNAEIEFTNPIDFVDELSLYVTGSNAWPQVLPIITLPGNCSYIVHNGVQVNDGDNGQADYSESLSFNIDFKNVGTVATSNVTAVLSTESPYVTITDSEATLGDFQGNQTIGFTNVFGITVSNDVPDLTTAQFIVTCSNGTDSWISKFSLKLHAPAFAITHIGIDDYQNGIIEPGETVTVHFTGINNGSSDSPQTFFRIYSGIPEITYEVNEFNLGTVTAGSSFECSFTFHLAENAQIGVTYQLPYIIGNSSTTNYTHDYFSFSVGQVMEGFENGNLASFDWNTNGASSPWHVVTENPYAGSYCCRSGIIYDNSEVSLSIELEVFTSGEISFYRKVSSESNFDYLYFYIDNNKMGEWSGEAGWGRESYPLTVGIHTLRWTYKKDYSMTSGEDCAWLDNITFPPTQVIMVSQEVHTDLPALYPNPNKGSFSINLPDEACDVTVFNSLGQVMYHEAKASGHTTFRLENLSKGMYFVNIKTNASVSTQKFVVE